MHNTKFNIYLCELFFICVLMKKLMFLILILSASLNSNSAGLVEGQRITKKNYLKFKVVKKEIRKLSKFQNVCIDQERNFFDVLSVSLKNISVKIFSIFIGDFLNFSFNNSEIRHLKPHNEIINKV